MASLRTFNSSPVTMQLSKMNASIEHSSVVFLSNRLKGRYEAAVSGATLRCSSQRSLQSPSSETHSPEIPTESSSHVLSALQSMEEERILKYTEKKSGKISRSAAGAVDWMLELAQGVHYEWPMFSWMKEGSKSQDGAQGFLETIVEEVEEKQETIPASPRCEWPRKLLKTKVEPVENDSARCSWPRTPAMASASVPTFARCDWPRKPTGLVDGESRIALDRSFKAPSVVDNVDSYGFQAARCSWPRPSAVSSKTVEPSPAFARCPWPRSVVEISEERHVADRNLSTPALALGPRCPWPRNRS